MLKYPNCPICRRLKELGVKDQKINDYHEGKIGMEAFPPEIFQELATLYDKLDYVTVNSKTF
jgi:hypothetical protein